MTSPSPRSHLDRLPLYFGLLVALGSGAAASASSCSAGDSNADDPGTVTGTAGSGGTSSAGGGGSGGTTTTGGSGGSAGFGGTGAAAGTGGTGGTAGSGGSGGGWPTCDAQPAGVPAKDIPTIWQDHASSSQPTELWVNDVIVTAISYGGCSQDNACQIFVQQDATYATLAAGAHHGIKLFVSKNTAQYFTGIAVGDVVDILGHAWRYDLNGFDELLLQVNWQLPGCIKDVGDATATPIPDVSLDDLTADTYENTYGPLLVRVPGVTGTPQGNNEFFGIWETGVGIGDAGVEQIKNLSHFFLDGGVFNPPLAQQSTDFVAVTGVFGMWIPLPDPDVYKYLMIYPRTMADIEQ